MNSIVFRGIPHKNFDSIIKAVRQWHEGEIILSTWNNVQINKDLVDKIDKIILSDDPGPMHDISNPSLVHSKRQILAAYNGVQASEGTKILLTRADMVHNISLFDFLDERDINKNIHNQVFKHKVICGNMMTLNPDISFGPARERHYRVCDWFQCGYREDILKYVDILDEFEKYRHSGCCLEQIWFLSCLNKHSNANIDLFNINENSETTKDNWKTMLTNFKIIDTRSTARSDNFRWLNQSEYCWMYITEKQYETKKEEMEF